MQASCAKRRGLGLRWTALIRCVRRMGRRTRLSPRASSSAQRSPAKKAAAHISGAIFRMPQTRSARSSRGKARTLPPLPDVVLEPIVKLALAEDLGVAGDVTTDALIDPDAQGRWALNARQAGVVAGLDAAMLAGWTIDPDMVFTIAAPDGAR